MSLPLDEDRLSKRKSIGDTISLQLEMDSRHSPEREQVRQTETTRCYIYTITKALKIPLSSLAAKTENTFTELNLAVKYDFILESIERFVDLNEHQVKHV